MKKFLTLAAFVLSLGLTGCSALVQRPRSEGEANSTQVKLSDRTAIFTVVNLGAGAGDHFDKPYPGSFYSHTEKVNYGTKARQYRWVAVLGSNWADNFVLTIDARVADAVPELHPLDLVEVFIPKIWELDYEAGNAVRVLRLVCRHEDEVCKDRLKAERGGWVTLGPKADQATIEAQYPVTPLFDGQGQRIREPVLPAQ